MTPDDFGFVATLLRDRAGLVLTRDKGYLVENRLGPLVRRHRMRGVGDLIAAIRAGDMDMRADAVDAMLPKDTGFFRDWKPFVHLRDIILPDLAARPTTEKRIRILCAGVSTGQEAYSVALAACQQPQVLEGWAVEIMGVDLSPSAIASAERAAYTQFEVQRGLPIRILARAFTKQDEHWLLDPAIRGMVGFKTWNLLDALDPLGRFDVVLCRNVLAYCDLQAKAAMLRRLARVMTGDGFLILGARETTTGITPDFRVVDAGLALHALQSGSNAAL